ncbi:cytochrome P450 [Xylariaceae sp. AK1471]|nr:cytochrome P450 [Xylariaceae sp. AK1471]
MTRLKAYQVIKPVTPTACQGGTSYTVDAGQVIVQFRLPSSPLDMIFMNSIEQDYPDFTPRHKDCENKDRISDLQLAAHLWDLVAGGSETTTSTAFSTCTYYILRDSTVIEKLKSEIRAAFSDTSEIKDASTKNLPNLNAVCLEAMRIYPPLPVNLPRLVPDGGDTVDGHFLPAGITIQTNYIAADLSSRNFQDPLSFKPERWLDLSRTEHDILEASQPFSLGARGCIGKSLGWMEMRTTFAKLTLTLEMELVDDELGWLRDWRMQTRWKKPPLNIRATLAG